MKTLKHIYTSNKTSINPLFKNIAACFIILLVLSCRQKNFQSPPGYDLNAPVVKNMDPALFEISGIAFMNDQSDTLLAINDEDGTLFYFTFNGDKTGSIKFMKKAGDFEDITIFKQSVYVLKSNGTIIHFPKQINGQQPDAVKHKNEFPSGQYESLYADEENNKLYALCKSCAINAGEPSIQGYYIDLANEDLQDMHPFTIDLSDLKLEKKVKKNFKPSAMTKNKKTNEWYILSSINHLLLVTDATFHVKATYPISPVIFIQPEGMAFDGKGNLYISNEGRQLSPGNVLQFKFNGK